MNKSQKPSFPFIFKPENVARYEDDEVVILDRRIYPFEKEFVHCKSHEEVAQAIEDMVTQSYGPRYAAGYGLALAAHEFSHLSSSSLQEKVNEAAARLIDTRPTSNQVRLIVRKMLGVAEEAIANKENPKDKILSAMDEEWEERDRRGFALGEHGASLLEDGDVILNHCWAENGIIYTLYAALEQGKELQAYCSETRPYLQGARLTADAIAEMGIPTKVVTDGMPSQLMYQGKITKFMCGADRVTMDGHVINKIGTLPHALGAHLFGVPTYVFAPHGPDPETETAEDVEIEERDPEKVLHCLGERTATSKAEGYYPAFDVTFPRFVSGIITDRGTYSPYTVRQYHSE